MSVINRVLNDIEERNKTQSQPDRSSFEPVAIKEPKTLVSAMLVITMAGLIALIVWIFKFSGNLSTPPDDTLLAPPLQQKAIEVASPSKAEIVKVKIKETDNQLADDIAEKAIVHNEKVIETAAIKQEKLTQPLAESKGQLVTPEPILVKNTAVHLPPPTVDKTRLSITPVSMSSAEIAQLKFSQGMKFQKLGKIDKAQASWRKALTIAPMLHEARIQLAASFYGENNPNKALELLFKADKKFPTFTGYRLLAAQIYYQLGQSAQALSALENPYLIKNIAKENLTLAASLAQQLKDWPQAQKNYQALVTREYDNSKWVLGLAIALDAQRFNEKALRQYIHLVTLHIDKAVHEYAQQRISVLTQELELRGSNG